MRVLSDKLLVIHNDIMIYHFDISFIIFRVAKVFGYCVQPGKEIQN